MLRPLLSLILIATCAVRGTAQEPHAGHAPAPPTGARADSAERLGEIRFPTSAGPAANAEFERGVLYLHNFHYPQAIAAFRRARALEPRDVMSAAFEALAHTHPVWNQQDTAAARAALRSLAPTRRARARLARTPRERAWLEAVETLYDGDTPKAVRDTAFSRAMQRLHAADPRDPEAASFYALSLLGLNQGDREARAYAEAEAVADTVLAAHPRHPGALHYKIHAVDDPANAARGLDAARAYGEVAPGAHHALHMTSHIYIARGMWDEVVATNRRAVRPAEPVPSRLGHYSHWLAYGLVQQGRVQEARGWVDSMLVYQAAVASGERPAPAIWGRAGVDVHVVFKAAAHVLDTNAWDSPLAHLRIDTTYAAAHPAALTLADFLVGFAAARRAARPVDLTPGNRAADRLLADSMLSRIAVRAARLRAAGATGSDLGETEVMERMLRAELQLQVVGGRPDSAVVLLRTAAEQLEALPFAFGPPQTAKPPRERAAEILLLTGRPAEALAELEHAELMAPGRTQARLVRARALLALGRRDEAAHEYRELAEVWRDADVGFPDREEARWGSTVLAAAASAERAVSIDTVGYPSGELALRGTLYRPKSAGRHPALVALHGSAGCWREREADLLGLLFAARGYVVFFPCRRGLGLSAGQGVAILDQLQREGYTARDEGYAARSTELLLTTQLPDVRAAIAALRARPDVDPARVAVTGISYGGILTLLAAEADPTLRAAIAFAPAAMNWGWNAPLRERLLAGARRTRVPTLVLQAENDWHVGPTSEIPDAIRAGGGEAAGRLYPAVGYNANDGHGLMVLAPEWWQDEVFEFLDRHLRTDAARGARRRANRH